MLARLSAIAGTLAEHGVKEITLTDAQGGRVRFTARQTDLPGEIARRLGALARGPEGGAAAGGVRLDDGNAEPEWVVEFGAEGMVCRARDAGLRAALLRATASDGH